MCTNKRVSEKISAFRTALSKIDAVQTHMGSFEALENQRFEFARTATRFKYDVRIFRGHKEFGI